MAYASCLPAGKEGFMVTTGFLRFACWGALSGLMAFVFIQLAFPHAGGSERAASPLVDGEEDSRFIVAFELSPEKNRSFAWPIESMRPAPYESVLMVVERMPRALEDTGRTVRSRPLLASRHLKINGRLQRPLRVGPAQGSDTRVNIRETFLVRLAQGRLNLELDIPAGTRFDPAHKTAKIKLYEVPKSPNSSRRACSRPASAFSEFFGVFHRPFQDISPDEILRSHHTSAAARWQPRREA
jgi:hypothetical protein